MIGNEEARIGELPSQVTHPCADFSHENDRRQVPSTMAITGDDVSRGLEAGSPSFRARVT